MSSILLFAFLLGVYSQGSLPTTTISTCGVFFNVHGGDGVRFCGGTCGNDNAPAAADPVCPPMPGDSVDTQVRWGESVTSGDPYAQSGLGFTGQQMVSVPLNREFFMGTLTHYNHPIIGPITDVTLSVTLSIPEFNVNQVFNFVCNVDETPNTVQYGPCPFPSTVPCSDKITFDTGGLDFQATFTIGQVSYTLQITGFKESEVSTSLPETSFISNEYLDNNAFLFARIVAACPTSCATGGTVEVVTDATGMNNCGCDCGSLACQAPQVLQNDCSCKCPPGTCNGAPTDASCNCLCPTPSSAMTSCPPNGSPSKTGWDTVGCSCICPNNVCGAGTLVDPASCSCSCAAVTCQNGNVPDPTNQCQCTCMAQCGPTQYLDTSNGNCQCLCSASATTCAPGFTLEVDPTNPTACKCGCSNVCGSGCGQVGQALQCNDDGKCCMNCQYQALPCDDGNPCTNSDTCDVVASIMSMTSVCKGKPACPVPLDTCSSYQCDMSSGSCQMSMAADGSACGPTGSNPQSWSLCQYACKNGHCVGVTVNCAMAVANNTDPSSCTGYACDPSSGMCMPGPKPGKACNDGNSCTANDLCVTQGDGSVQCMGTLNNCSSMLPPQCNTLQCDPRIGVCAAVPVPYGTTCLGDGTSLCDVNGICSGGVCLFKRSCPDLDPNLADPTCNDNICDPSDGVCKPSPSAVGSACVLANGLPREMDYCGQNYTCTTNTGYPYPNCTGQIRPDRLNDSNCVSQVVVASAAGKNAALIAGLTAAGAFLLMIIIAALLCAFVNKSQLTDPSTWNMGADVAVQNSPMYDQSGGGKMNALFEGN